MYLMSMNQSNAAAVPGSAHSSHSLKLFLSPERTHLIFHNLLQDGISVTAHLCGVGPVMGVAVKLSYSVGHLPIFNNILCTRTPRLNPVISE